MKQAVELAGGSAGPAAEPPESSWDDVVRNLPGDDAFATDSFIGRLIDDAAFDVGEFLRLESALATLSAADAEIREAALVVYTIQARAALAFESHFDPHDGYEIENIGDRELRDYAERLRRVGAAFIGGDDYDLQAVRKDHGVLGDHVPAGPCESCGRRGELRHFPGASPSSGVWCERHYRRLLWLHPLGHYGRWLWGAALVAVAALVVWFRE